MCSLSASVYVLKYAWQRDYHQEREIKTCQNEKYFRLISNKLLTIQRPKIKVKLVGTSTHDRNVKILHT